MQLCSYAVVQLCRSETETPTGSKILTVASGESGQLCRSEAETLTESVKAVAPSHL